MASRFLFNNGFEIDQALSGAYPNIITRGSGFVRDTGVQDISGVKYFYDSITFYSGVNITGDFAIIGNVVGGLFPSQDNAYDLGSLSQRWKDQYISGTARINTLIVEGVGLAETDFYVGGNLTVTGNFFAEGDVVVTGNASVLGNISSQQNISALGEISAQGNCYIVGDFVPSGFTAENLIPKVDDFYDLGSSLYKWRNLYLNGIGEIDSLVVNEDAIILSGLSVGQSLVVTGSVTAIGASTAASYGTSGSGTFGKLFITGTGVPTSSTGIGVMGQILQGSGYLYVCTGTNLWGRTHLAGWV